MKLVKSILLILSAAVVLSSCEKVDPPYKTGVGFDCDAGNKKVLIEDYTGHGCVNCPGAAVIAHELHAMCEDRVIIMSVHAGYFANTEDFGPEYTYDFTTEAGNVWNSYYKVLGNPKGMINRSDEGSGVVVVPEKWGEMVVKQLETPSIIELNIKNSFNDSEGKLTTTVSGTLLSATSERYLLVVCVTENHIIKPQKNNDTEIGDVPDDLNYEHMHVLRVGINGAWGDEVVYGNMNAGFEFTKTYTQSFSGTDWVTENCNVVAFVYKDSDKSIEQVEEAPVVE